jgi:hypothetical protein
VVQEGLRGHRVYSKEREKLRAIPDRPPRWVSLFKYDPHLSMDTILAVVQILKNHENSES